MSNIITLIAIFCLAASPLVHASGIVSVSVQDINNSNGEATESEFIEFDYESVEWNSNTVDWNNEWSVEEDGVGEFELTDQAGDAVIIRARDVSDSDDVSAILDTVTRSPAGGETTVASLVGNSISAALFPSSEAVASNTAAAPAVVSVPVVAGEGEEVAVASTATESSVEEVPAATEAQVATAESESVADAESAVESGEAVQAVSESAQSSESAVSSTEGASSTTTTTTESSSTGSQSASETTSTSVGESGNNENNTEDVVVVSEASPEVSNVEN